MLWSVTCGIGESVQRYLMYEPFQPSCEETELQFKLSSFLIDVIIT